MLGEVSRGPMLYPGYEHIQWAQDYLSLVSARWDEALGRLKAFVED